MSRNRPARDNERFVKGGSHGDLDNRSCAQEGIFSAAGQRRFLQDCGRARSERSGRLSSACAISCETEVAPIIEDYWGRDQFPHEIIPKLRALDVNIAGVGYRGYGSAGGSWLLNGFVAMEMARIDCSVATFWGVHTGLSAGSIYLCGDEAQKQRWLPPMMRLEKIGSLRPDRAAGRLGDLWRNADDLPPRGRHLDPQRPEEMDRQRHLRRHQCDLGARGGVGPGQGLRRREGQSRLFGREDQDQDGAARGAERADHAEGLPRARGGPTAEGQLVQGLRPRS